MPRYPELKSGIFAKVAYGKFPNELLVSVVAHGAEEVPFQPRQLTLSPSVTREVVVFRDGNPDGWRVADNFQLPDWLNVKWSPFNGNAGMEIELRNGELPAVQSREPIEVRDTSDPNPCAGSTSPKVRERRRPGLWVYPSFAIG